MEARATTGVFGVEVEMQLFILSITDLTTFESVPHEEWAEKEDLFEIGNRFARAMLAANRDFRHRGMCVAISPTSRERCSMHSLFFSWSCLSWVLRSIDRPDFHRASFQCEIFATDLNAHSTCRLSARNGRCARQMGERCWKAYRSTDEILGDDFVDNGHVPVPKPSKQRPAKANNIDINLSRLVRKGSRKLGQHSAQFERLRKADMMSCYLDSEKCHQGITSVMTPSPMPLLSMPSRAIDSMTDQFCRKRADASCMFEAFTLTQHARRPPSFAI
jgi:hypothetical protein